MDTVKELGELALATRLKRLGERLSRDVSLLYKKLDIDFEAKWFPIISALQAKSPKAITELASDIGITHTAVNQLANELLKKGYITSSRGNDERQRLLSLSSKGTALCTTLKPVWEKVKLVNKELIDNIDPVFLKTLSIIEKELDNCSMYERMWLKLYGTLPANILIMEYNQKLKKHFQKLNYEWLEEYFTIEEKDKQVLLHPKEKIINKNGTILFAAMDDEIVGTCAIMKHPGNKYELAKMAVTKKYRGRGIGKLLLKEAIKKARLKGVSELYLQTSEKLASANALYQSFGFTRLRENPFNEASYLRETFAMKLNLGTTNI